MAVKYDYAYRVSEQSNKKFDLIYFILSRHRLHSTAAMNMLNCFIKQLYVNDNCDKIVCIGDIYEMIWSHSQFLDIMLSPNEADNLVKGLYSTTEYIWLLKVLFYRSSCSIAIDNF